MKAFRILKPIALAAVLSLGLSACVAHKTGPNEQLGGLLGAAAGGLIGSHIGKGDGRLAATAAGAVLGAAVGSDLGKTVDRQERLERKHKRVTVVYPEERQTHPSKHHKRGRALPPIHDDYDIDDDWDNPDWRDDEPY